MTFALKSTGLCFGDWGAKISTADLVAKTMFSNAPSLSEFGGVRGARANPSHPPHSKQLASTSSSGTDSEWCSDSAGTARRPPAVRASISRDQNAASGLGMGACSNRLSSAWGGDVAELHDSSALATSIRWLSHSRSSAEVVASRCLTSSGSLAFRAANSAWLSTGVPPLAVQPSERNQSRQRQRDWKFHL